MVGFSRTQDIQIYTLEQTYVNCFTHHILNVLCTPATLESKTVALLSTDSGSRVTGLLKQILKILYYTNFRCHVLGHSEEPNWLALHNLLLQGIIFWAGECGRNKK